ncbi:MAG: sigma-70 family RNA polymerase sigma factor [Spirochaetales bacterium]|nr:sigma-70 family RNA polymerase sigma factor [Spirochaetales bacterium]
MIDEKIGRTIEEYEERIEGFFRKKINNIEDIEDLTQDAIIAVIQSYSRFQSRSLISTWIYGICRNVLNSYFYKKTRDRKNPGFADKEEAGLLEKTLLKIAIDRLPPRFETIYDLFYVKKYSIKEIGKLLEKPEGTIKYYLYELRGRIKRYYNENG